jgi:hypothetical protein
MKTCKTCKREIEEPLPKSWLILAFSLLALMMLLVIVTVGIGYHKDKVLWQPMKKASNTWLEQNPSFEVFRHLALTDTRAVVELLKDCKYQAMKSQSQKCGSAYILELNKYSDQWVVDSDSLTLIWEK